MIWGLTTSAFTQVHVVISLIGIFTGLIVVGGMLAGKRLHALTAVFLATTIATSVTGFGFPIHHFGPPHIVGVISLVVLAIALLARYSFHMRGAWRWIYVVTSVTALYLNVFVGIVQAFQKVPALKALAPTQAEPPFAIAQLAALVVFILLAIFASLRFRPAPLSTYAAPARL
jgi:glucan phosphoethanolaminetransferase (alkaline phosphatase superfamily)